MTVRELRLLLSGLNQDTKVYILGPESGCDDVGGAINILVHREQNTDTFDGAHDYIELESDIVDDLYSDAGYLLTPTNMECTPEFWKKLAGIHKCSACGKIAYSCVCGHED